MKRNNFKFEKEKNLRFFSPSPFPKSRKGAEKTISIYWFAILIIVAGAIVYMVSLVYGQPYNVREVEAEILANNVADCVSEGGLLKEKTLGDVAFQENFLKQCSLNFEAIDFSQSNGEYYVEMNFFDFNSGNKINFDILAGIVNLRQYCELNGETQPACFKKSFYLIDKVQKSYRIDITAVVNKATKNI